jgi:membrane-associated phospholipid phosphatase
MSRGVGAVEAIQSMLLEWATPALVALTQLGDVWFYFLLLPPLYWFGSAQGWFRHRDDAALLVGVSLSAFALVVALKGFFALERPPSTLQLQAHYGSGFGFPSGHALGSTAVYGGIAVLLDRWRRSTRLAAAAVIVAVVSFTRVALGVHYLVDVVAGVAVGALVVVGVLRLGRERAAYSLWVAVAFGVLAVVTSGVTADAVTALGGAVGAAVAWAWVENRPTHVNHDVSAALGVGALVVLGSLKAAQYVYFEELLPVVLAVNVVVLAGIVALPGVHRQ